MNTLYEKPKTETMGAVVPDNEFQYQTISKSAIACCVFAALGISAYLAQMFVVIPMLGIGFGALALINIRKYPDELVGRKPAMIGLIACLVLFVTSVGMHAYIYATEVPDGYRRITFWELRNNKRDTQIPFSRNAYDFNGEKVFLKGYVRPNKGKKNGLKQFILVGDLGDCCFGGVPEIDEAVAIDIISDDSVNQTLGLRRIGGVFRLNEALRPVDEDGIPVVYYTIEADYIR